MDGPFGDFTVTPNHKGLALSDNRERRQVDVRRRRTIDCDLRFASVAALVERREIHERELDRPLELINVGAGKKYDRVRRIDALDRLVQSMRLGIGEKPEHRLLQITGNFGMARTHRSSAQNTLRHLGERFAPVATGRARPRGYGLTGLRGADRGEGTLRSEEVWHGN
jgi:hypothetical protein